MHQDFLPWDGGIVYICPSEMFGFPKITLLPFLAPRVGQGGISISSQHALVIKNLRHMTCPCGGRVGLKTILTSSEVWTVIVKCLLRDTV